MLDLVAVYPDTVDVSKKLYKYEHQGIHLSGDSVTCNLKECLADMRRKSMLDQCFVARIFEYLYP